MKSWLPSTIAALAVALTGCNNLEVCGASYEDLKRSDQSLYRCTLAEECPRSSREFVCVTDVTSEAACIKCVETRCVRVTPEPC